jgi:hypothetical protein
MGSNVHCFLTNIQIFFIIYNNSFEDDLSLKYKIRLIVDSIAFHCDKKELKI